MHSRRLIAIYLQNTNATFCKVVQKHYSGEVENADICVLRTICTKFCQNWLVFVEDMTKNILCVFFRFTVYIFLQR